MATSTTVTTETTYQLAEPSPELTPPVDSQVQAPNRLEPAVAEPKSEPAVASIPKKSLLNRLFGTPAGAKRPAKKSKTTPGQPNSDSPNNSDPKTPSETQKASETTNSDAPKPTKRRRRRANRWGVPAWGLSIIVHTVVLSMLALATLNEEVRSKLVNLNTSMLKDTSGSAAELTKIYADPSEGKRENATGDENSDTSGAGKGDAPPASGLAMAGGGLPGPSPTPRIGAVGKVEARGGSGAGSGGGLSNLKAVAHVSGLSLMPAAPTRDLGGGGKIVGDVAFEAGEIGEALDQLGREILRHLNDHKLTVIWLFDESESMIDDQKIIRSKFNKIAGVLKQHVDADRKASNALNHVIVGFGKDTHFMLPKPTADIDAIGKAIDHLRIDDTGLENVCSAIEKSIARYSSLISKDRRLLIVLVTDESGDDGAFVEEARQAAVSHRTPIYILGRQAIFGYPYVQFQYIDPVTKDVYYPTIRRGPETAGLETLQWDGLRGRVDELPSGFAPYELARLAKDSGGIYFLLPSEETMRIRQREKAYSMASMKEYSPDYESRTSYEQKRKGSDLRRSLYDIIEATRSGDFNYRLSFPVMPDELVPAATMELAKADERLKKLLVFEDRLRKLAMARDRETDKRWQASYDLMLAEMVAYEITAYEYKACMKELIKQRPKPSELPNPKLVVEWHLGHTTKRKAPESETEKKYAEAKKLYQVVIQRHPNTPWSDLAQNELNRGFSVAWGEAKWKPSTTRDQRAKLVPKY